MIVIFSRVSKAELRNSCVKKSTSEFCPYKEGITSDPPPPPPSSSPPPPAQTSSSPAGRAGVDYQLLRSPPGPLQTQINKQAKSNSMRASRNACIRLTSLIV